MTASIMKNNINVQGLSIGQIGSDSKYFSGHFDGCGYTISGLSNTLFGFNSGTIQNLTVSGAQITSGYKYCAGFYVGGLVIQNFGTISNCTLTNSNINVENSDPGNNYTHYIICVGGICGYNSGTIERCTVSNTTVKSYQRNFIPDGGGAAEDIYGYVGGIVGYIENGKMTDCLSIGNTIYSKTRSVSYNANFWIKLGFVPISKVDMFYKCDGYSYAGGLAGFAASSVITRCMTYGLQSVVSEWVADTAQANGNKEKDYRWHEKGAAYKDNHIPGNSSSTIQHCLNDSVTDNLAEEYRKNGWAFDNGTQPSLDFKGTSISIVSFPYKTIYSPNQNLETAGLLLKTNTGYLIADGYTVENFDTSTVGEKNITINFISPLL